MFNVLHQKVKFLAGLLLLAVGDIQARSHYESVLPNDNSSFPKQVLYYAGLWEGIDPLDGANVQRTMIPVNATHLMFTGRIDYSQICGGSTEGNATIEGLPPITSRLVPALLNGFGQVDETTGYYEMRAALTCFGDRGPRVSGVPATYIPTADHVIQEVPSFRPGFPIYLFRVSQVDLGW